MKHKTKMVKCGYEKCCERRIHFENPNIMRSHQTVEVPIEFNEKTQKCFCSFECAIYAGYFSITKGWIKNPSGGKKTLDELNNEIRKI